MKIEVTQADIDLATEYLLNGNCGARRCPIALAAGRLYPDREITAGFSWICVSTPDKVGVELALKGTEDMKQFMIMFDNHLPVLPAVFETEIDTEF